MKATTAAVIITLLWMLFSAGMFAMSYMLATGDHPVFAFLSGMVGVLCLVEASGVTITQRGPE